MTNDFPLTATRFVRDNYPSFVLQPVSNGSPMWFADPESEAEIVIYRIWGKVVQYTNDADTSGIVLFTGATL